MFFLSSSLLCFLASAWNVFRHQSRTFETSTVTLLFAGMFLLGVWKFDVKSINIFGTSITTEDVETVKKSAGRAEQSAIDAKLSTEKAGRSEKAVKELVAVQALNLGRFPSPKAHDSSQELGKRLLLEVYGSEYQPRVRKLLSDGILNMPQSQSDNLKELGISPGVVPSNELPYFQQMLQDSSK